MGNEVQKQIMNHKAAVIDELNRRIEEAEEKEEYLELEVLNDFYDWYVESFLL